MRLACCRCDAFLGEMEKGKIKKDIVLLCNDCMDKLKIFEDLCNKKYGNGNDYKGSDGMPDFFKKIFNGDKQ